MSIILPETSKWFEDANNVLRKRNTIMQRGRVDQVIGMVIESIGPSVSVGDRCVISASRDREIQSEVVGFRSNRVLLMPLGSMEGINSGSLVTASYEPFTIGVGKELLGRVLDGFGKAIDGKGPIQKLKRYPLNAPPPPPLSRNPISEPLPTGIRSIDSLITCGKGQRFGVFAGSGVGKSVLMGMIARYTKASINVIGLIGERGREVKEFIENELGEAGLARSVVIAVTSDEPALLRIKGGFAATTIAEYFRDQGIDVMLMMDSVTRLAMAQREIGLAVGEPPTTRGYTPSLFAMLPKLLERSGNSKSGSITGLYTILVEGDDLNEPVSDAVRSILDGHIVLSRKLAEKGHYPAVDPLASLSRVMQSVVSPSHLSAARNINRLLSVYKEAEDLVNIGAYKKGSNPEIDRAIAMHEVIEKFLVQALDQGGEYRETVNLLEKIADACDMKDESNSHQA